MSTDADIKISAQRIASALEAIEAVIKKLVERADEPLPPARRKKAAR